MRRVEPDERVERERPSVYGGVGRGVGYTTHTRARARTRARTHTHTHTRVRTHTHTRARTHARTPYIPHTHTTYTHHIHTHTHIPILKNTRTYLGHSNGSERRPYGRTLRGFESAHPGLHQRACFAVVVDEVAGHVVRAGGRTQGHTPFLALTGRLAPVPVVELGVRLFRLNLRGRVLPRRGAPGVDGRWTRESHHKNA